MADIRWQVKCSDEDSEQRFGTYFLRTNIPTLDERSTWDYYNLIREIETSNRQLKTDLELRPIYHQKDDNSDAHLFFGLLSYWIVNTIRYKLKQRGITHYWTELKRILSTQKAITTEAENALGEHVEMRLCSDPTDSAAEMYRLSATSLNRSSDMLFNHPRKKSVVPTRKLKKNKFLVIRLIAEHRC